MIRRELAFALFCLLVYLLSGAGVITHIDGVVNYALARRMVDQHTFSLDPSDPALANNYELVAGRDGNTYAHFNPGLPLLVAPLYVFGKILSPLVPRVAEFTAADFMVSTTNAFVSSGAVLLVLVLVRTLGYPPRAELLAGAAFAFGTLVWTYATTLFTEPATGACLLLSILLLVRSRTSPRPTLLLFAAGLAAGGAVFMRVSGAVFVPGLMLYALVAHRRAGWRLVWLLGAFGLGCAVFLTAIGWYNLVRFGSILETGYTVGPNELTSTLNVPTEERGLGSTAYALYALLVSPGRGVFVFAPALVLGVLGLWSFARRWPLEATIFVFLSGSLLLAEAILPFDYWFGGWSYGSRYLLPIVGLGCVCSAAWFAQVSQGPNVGRLAGGVIAVLVAAQLPTVLANVNTAYYRAQVARGTELDHVYLVESWQGSTLVGAWEEFARLTQRTLEGQPVPRGRLGEMPDVATALDNAEVFNTFQPWWLRLAETGRVTGTMAGVMFGGVAALMLVAGLALRRATRPLGDQPRSRGRATGSSLPAGLEPLEGHGSG